MASIDEVNVQVLNIQKDAEELVQVVSNAGQTLRMQAQSISALCGRVSQSGREAAMATTVAARSVQNAAASIQSLNRICGQYLQELRR